MSSASVKVRSVDDETWIVTVEGSISFSVNQEFKEALEEVQSRSPSRLLVDLTGVSFCNSMGFRDLMQAYTRQVQHEGKFALVAPTAEIRKVLEITKFSSIIEIYPSVEASLGA